MDFLGGGETTSHLSSMHNSGGKNILNEESRFFECKLSVRVRHTLPAFLVCLSFWSPCMACKGIYVIGPATAHSTLIPLPGNASSTTIFVFSQFFCSSQKIVSARRSLSFSFFFSLPSYSSGGGETKHTDMGTAGRASLHS